MPVKARYWRDPEKHRAEWRNRSARLRALGITAIQQYSYEAAAKRRAYQSKWGKTHRAANRASSDKYRLKVRKMFGSDNNITRWQYVMYNKERNYAQRKQAAASLPSR